MSFLNSPNIIYRYPNVLFLIIILYLCIYLLLIESLLVYVYYTCRGGKGVVAEEGVVAVLINA